MRDLFKEVAHPYNFREIFISCSYKIKTVCYGTEAITYLGSNIWPNAPSKIKEFVILEVFHQRIKVWKLALYISNVGIVNLGVGGNFTPCRFSLNLEMVKL